MFNNIPLLNHRRGLLAVESDGYRLRAAVVNARNGSVAIEDVVESFRTDQVAALTDAINQLGPRNVPNQAILLLPQAIQTVMELPVDPSSPLPETQMHEMVRWELEALMAQQIGTGMIGEILLAHDFITMDQVEMVCAEVERRRHDPTASGPAAGTSNRFGEVATELGIITREQLDTCLTIQRTNLEDVCVCGWAPQTDPGSYESAQHSWLVAGISRNVRQRWLSAFEEHAIKLAGIYPLVGCAAAAIAETKEPVAVVLEAQHGMVATTLLENGRVRDFSLAYTAGPMPSIDQILEMLGRDSRGPVWLAGRGPRLSGLAQELSNHTGRNVSMIPLDIELSAGQGEAPEALANIMGASRNALRLPGAEHIASAPAHEPSPPWWRNAGNWARAAGVFAAVAIGAIEISHASKLSQAMSAKIVLEDRLNESQRNITFSQSQALSVEQLVKRVEQLERELERAERRSEFLAYDVPRRNRCLPALLDAVARASTHEVVVDRIAETEPAKIRIAGWATSQIAAEQFAHALNTDLRAIGLAPTSSPVLRESPGRLGLDGYAIQLDFGPANATNQLLGQTSENHR